MKQIIAFILLGAFLSCSHKPKIKYPITISDSGSTTHPRYCLLLANKPTLIKDTLGNKYYEIKITQERYDMVISGNLPEIDSRTMVINPDKKEFLWDVPKEYTASRFDILLKTKWRSTEQGYDTAYSKLPIIVKQCINEI